MERGPLLAIVLAGFLLLLAACGGGGSQTSPESQALASARDADAQSDLRNALVTAKVYFTEGGTYSGFDPAVAGSIEPSLSWKGNEPASSNAVSINVAQDSLLVFSTKSESGQAFCIADDSSVVTYGRTDAVDARTLADCESQPSEGW